MQFPGYSFPFFSWPKLQGYSETTIIWISDATWSHHELPAPGEISELSELKLDKYNSHLGFSSIRDRPILLSKPMGCLVNITTDTYCRVDSPRSWRCNVDNRSWNHSANSARLSIWILADTSSTVVHTRMLQQDPPMNPRSTRDHKCTSVSKRGLGLFRKRITRNKICHAMYCVHAKHVSEICFLRCSFFKQMLRSIWRIPCQKGERLVRATETNENSMPRGQTKWSALRLEYRSPDIPKTCAATSWQESAMQGCEKTGPKNNVSIHNSNDVSQK